MPNRPLSLSPMVVSHVRAAPYVIRSWPWPIGRLTRGSSLRPTLVGGAPEGGSREARRSSVCGHPRPGCVGRRHGRCLREHRVALRWTSWSVRQGGGEREGRRRDSGARARAHGGRSGARGQGRRLGFGRRRQLAAAAEAQRLRRRAVGPGAPRRGPGVFPRFGAQRTDRSCGSRAVVRAAPGGG